MTDRKKYTWIIGASEGIGEALAKELARKGEVLCLSARNEERLKIVHSSLEGDNHIFFPFDVSHKDKMKEALEEINNKFPEINRVIFMAGLYTPTKFGQINLNEAEQIIAVNLTSVFYLIENVLPVMENQNHGQIAICGSVAGYAGLPNSQPYGATKAAIINLVESLKAEVKNSIDIKLINPGFVKTRLTDKNDFDMPARISVEEAASIISKELDGNKFEIHFPKRFTYVMKFITNLPYLIYFKIIKKLNK